MAIIAKASGGNFIPCPAGIHAAVCVDVVDLGDLEVNFGGKQKVQHKIRIVWQVEELMPNNNPYTVSKRYTLSLHEKSSLRKDLESWRGRSFTEEELQGFDVETVLSAGAYLNVIQEVKNGSTYSNVASIMRLPKGMETPTPHGYVRVCDREADQAPTVDEPTEYGVTLDDVPF